MAKKIVVRRKKRACETVAPINRYKARYFEEYARIQAKKDSNLMLRDTEKMILDGKSFITVSVPVDLWWAFVDQNCEAITPNEAVTELIRGAVK